MNTRLLVLPCLLSGFLLAGCVSDDAVEPVETSTETTVKSSNQAEFGRTLQLLDKHVSKYVFWKSEGGDDAKRERYIERSTCVSLVRLVEPQLIATAADSSMRNVGSST